jgi:hypothetical protein
VVGFQEEEENDVLESLKDEVVSTTIPTLSKYCSLRRKGDIPPPPGSELNPTAQLQSAEDTLKLANEILLNILWFQKEEVVKEEEEEKKKNPGS